ncbi:MAG: amidohydrolase family protein [Armatimonadetes bacterium]|nr:amidohydrolase family protein [Armatimonadota bacterium]MDW8121054.1 amidohydrolase family protein [Armatimonadota bacterium]
MATTERIPIVDCDTWVGFYPFQDIDLTPATLTGIMRRFNVARAIFVHTTAVFFDPKVGNDMAIMVARENGGLLLPAATVNPLFYRGLAKEVEKRKEQGFRLFRFFPRLQSWLPRSAVFKDLANFLNGLGLPFLIECPFSGWATDIGQVVAGLSVPVVLTGTAEDNLAEILSVMKEITNLHLSTQGLDHPGALEEVVAEVGPGRLIFGSGAPIHYFQSSLMPLLHSDLSDEAKTLVLVENLRRIVQA